MNQLMIRIKGSPTTNPVAILTVGPNGGELLDNQVEILNPVVRSGELGEPGSDPGNGGGGTPGVFDACDAAVYCILAEEDSSNFNGFFNEQQECTSASSDSTYDDWFTCVVDNKGEPCSGAGGGDWSGCDCSAVQTCSDNNANPL